MHTCTSLSDKYQGLRIITQIFSIPFDAECAGSQVNIIICEKVDELVNKKLEIFN